MTSWHPDQVGDAEEIHYRYNYTTGKNLLESIDRRTMVNGNPSYVSDRTFGYDARGNVGLNSKRDILTTEYGRANLPWEIHRYFSNDRHLSYRYDANDARIYKEARTSDLSVVTL